ncbi:MAG TPA: sugar dehydrogenase complex small subunit [Methyloceanibacter sp.]|nr:sugar dehydrogenase complex small subunit [Methyloceanibacter sp.]
MIEAIAGGTHVQGLSRRGVILGGASVVALAVAFPLGSRAQASLTVDQFRALSARLTGAGLSDLDPAATAKLLDGFNSLGRGADPVALAASGAVSGALADDIVAAWYSGAYQTAAGLADFNLTHALVWRALDFTKPPGLCGGPTGYWADAPHA